MQKRHKNRSQYFEEQSYTTKKYVIPFVEESMKLTAEMRVLEIGCGEGGNIPPFLELGMEAVGVDIFENTLNNARKFLKDNEYGSKVELILSDIYDLDASSLGTFDLIIMRDVIEHIHNQEKFLDHVKQFLKSTGKLFFGFPPWYMPFGGHQQICKNKFLSKLPYFHILPKPIYRMILKAFGEADERVEVLFEIKDTGITIDRLDKILRKNNFKSDIRRLYLINPNYEVKFNLNPRVQFGLLGKIPFFRNFITTCAYYLVSSND